VNKHGDNDYASDNVRGKARMLRGVNEDQR
jgi:hypothetical protein